jgi:putative PIN family toxin of toxin-antitoxin system
VSGALRAVLDTNVLVSALLYRDGELSWLQGALEQGTIVPLGSGPVATELTRILHQLGEKKFGLDREAVDAIVTRYLRWTVLIDDGTPIEGWLPKCKDRDDQMFLDLAARGHADILVTSDNALLGLHRKTAFAIVSPGKFRKLVLG